ncbi:hypothetical protein JST97_37020 [bacterium]|nr:hypothetical protein [bacterium]
MHKEYQELPVREGGILPAPAPPPPRSGTLGKPGARFISERLVGRLEEHQDGHSLRLRVNGRRLSMAQLKELLKAHVGYEIELTLYEDNDPDILSRMSEALEGIQGSFEWSGPSIYIARLEYELRQAFPDRQYLVKLKGEVLHIGRVQSGAVQALFRLKSPALKHWVLGQPNQRPEGFGSFMQAVERLLSLEKTSGGPPAD